jgi:two-component system sensor histidine kinase KdpD
MPMENGRPTPEQLLRKVESEERVARQGKLKVVLGYASGVGKSFRMFDEGRRRKLRGQDVVVGGMQANNPVEVLELLGGFEIIPPLARGQVNVTAILHRHPQVCLIDGLAYENPSGSKNAYRWQDVEELLAAGISVITSVNLQFVKERQPQVEMIRGKAVLDSVPEAFLHRANEIEIVDAPPEYCAEIADARKISELREIALLLAADVVDHQLEEYLRAQGLEQTYGTHERILVCITPRSNAELMIHRGRRQADRFHGELHVAYVEQEGLCQADRRIIGDHLAAARDANAQVAILHGEDPVAAILAYAKRHGITQLFAGHSRQRGWLSRWLPNVLERLILSADGMDVRIFPNA